MIKQQFLSGITTYTTNGQALALWNEVEKSYSHSSRHYHNLTHLGNLTHELIPFKEKFINWDVVIFSIAYHDIVYNTLKSDNEEKSATLAVKRLSKINVPASVVESCKAFILATKLHDAHSEETDLFTDADLSILGANSEDYERYARQIRLEYSWYPDFVYNPGRKKVLLHFLKMATIFKTREFQHRYETAARRNIQAELERL